MKSSKWEPNIIKAQKHNRIATLFIQILFVLLASNFVCEGQIISNNMNRENEVTANFTWNLLPRATSGNVYDKVNHKYDSEYVNPNSYSFSFNACNNAMDQSNLSYKWVFRQGISYINTIETEKCYLLAVRNITDNNLVSGGQEYIPLIYRNPIEAVNLTGLEIIEFPYPPNGEPVARIHYTEKLPGYGPFNVTLTVTNESGDIARSSQTINSIKDLLIVTIGDSYASGQGNPNKGGSLVQDQIFDLPFLDGNEDLCKDHTSYLYNELGDRKLEMDPEPVWIESVGYRSDKSGFQLAAKLLESESNKNTSVTFLNFANSGARIRKGILNSQGLYRVDNVNDYRNGQLFEISNTIGIRKIDVLLISVGGNDVGFSKIISEATKNNLLESNLLDQAWTVIQDSLQVRLSDLANEIDSNFDVKNVIIVGYPTDVFSVMNENGDAVTSDACGIFKVDNDDIASRFGSDGILEDERRILKDLGIELNRQLAVASFIHGWRYIRMDDKFAGHGYCSEDSYFRSAEESCAYQGDFEGIMHPNRKGQEVYGDAIFEALYRIIQ